MKKRKKTQRSSSYSYTYEFSCFSVPLSPTKFGSMELYLYSQKSSFTPKIAKEFRHSVSLYVRSISRKYEKIHQGPIKSHLVMIETPISHSTSRRDVVFAVIEKHIGIVFRFLISIKGSSFHFTLKLHRNHNLNNCVRRDILLRRLCP